MKRLLSIFIIAAALSVDGYDFTTRKGLRWADGEIPVNLQLDLTRPPQLLSDGKISWNQVADEALETWNTELSRVRFTTYTNSQRGDGNDRNEVFFSTTVYGHPLGDRVLGITTTWRIGTERVESDTVLNSEVEWDSYRGPLDSFGGVDLRRVLIHEFGHNLGLDHPDEAGQVEVAIMNSIVSDLDNLAMDDIHGARALYPPNERYGLQFDVAPPEGGEVFTKTPAGVDGLYAAGTVATFLAKPKRGFRFGFWGGDESQASRKLVVRVVDNQNITATFFTNGAPVIRTHPRSQLASTGESPTFTVRASSPRGVPASYQWQHNGGDIPGATNASLTLRFVGHPSSGLYSVRVTNARGEAFSKPARLVVDGY